MIQEIYLPDTLKNEFSLEHSSPSLANLNRINIFIGPNNSGKSRFLRGIFRSAFPFLSDEISYKEIAHSLDSLLQDLTSLSNKNGYEDVNYQNTVGSTVLHEVRNLITYFREFKLPSGFQLINEVKHLSERLSNYTFGGGQQKQGTHASLLPHEFSNLVRQMGVTFSQRLIPLIENVEEYHYKKIYVPILRGLRPIQFSGSESSLKFDNKSDNYDKRTVKDYFARNVDSRASSVTFDIFTGLSLFIEIKGMLLGSLNDRKKVRQFEEFLSISFFDNEEVSLTPHQDEECLYITIGTEDRPIYDLGDGIQTLIILLYPLFKHSETPLLYFIEEPELSLHPGMQRLFLDTIMSDKFKDAQVFLTTHSNHFLDMTLDHENISIYNFTKEASSDKPRYHIYNTQNKDIKLLDSIGVRNSSIFMSNCTIWVEGICDRLYINKYMEVYQRDLFGEAYETKRLKEDLHYSFIEYGGSNLVHYSFEGKENWDRINASRLSNRIFLIADMDDTQTNTTSKKAIRLAELEVQMKPNFFRLACREIENSLSPCVLESVVREWGGDNSASFSNIFLADYEFEYLGSFIDNRFPSSKRKFAADSGTISDKVRFCRMAIGNINEVADLTPTALNLTKAVFQFIQNHNFPKIE